jgi:hypothetical protein
MFADTVEMLKGDSAEFVNRQKCTRQKFRWEEGYGAFTQAAQMLTLKPIKFSVKTNFTNCSHLIMNTSCC